MRPVSTLFKQAITSSHQAVIRVRACAPAQFGLNPVGTEIPVLDGDVKLSASNSIKSTLDLEIPGEYWDQVQPYGTELFVERGIDYGDGTREFVGLGYFRINEITQDDAPTGPIKISGGDRTSQMMQNRVLYPYQFPAGKTYKYAFDRLVNGDPNATGVASTEGYGMFLFTIVPIVWGFTPTTVTVPAGSVVEDSTFDFLTKLLQDVGDWDMRFNASGQLTVISTAVSNIPVATISRGVTMTSASRGVTRDGVFNIVSAYGSDPAFPTPYGLQFNYDSRIGWTSNFGAAPRYYASPLIKSGAQATNAAGRVLSQYTKLPSTLSLHSVPDPSLEPFDVIDVNLGTPNTPDMKRVVIDEVTIPLVASDDLQIVTRELTSTELVTGV